MYVTLTSIRLKKLWFFFKLSYLGLQIVRQTRKEKGFIKMKNTGFGYMHYTASIWASEEDLKRFSRSGAHIEAMKQGPAIATEVKTYTYPAQVLPDWKTAKQLLKEKGKAYSF